MLERKIYEPPANRETSSNPRVTDRRGEPPRRVQTGRREHKYGHQAPSRRGHRLRDVPTRNPEKPTLQADSVRRDLVLRRLEGKQCPANAPWRFWPWRRLYLGGD